MTQKELDKYFPLNVLSWDSEIDLVKNPVVSTRVSCFFAVPALKGQHPELVTFSVFFSHN